jgi:hypothetical protein
MCYSSPKLEGLSCILPMYFPAYLGCVLLRFLLRMIYLYKKKDVHNSILVRWCLIMMLRNKLNMCFMISMAVSWVMQSGTIVFFDKSIEFISKKRKFKGGATQLYKKYN